MDRHEARNKDEAPKCTYCNGQCIVGNWARPCPVCQGHAYRPATPQVHTIRAVERYAYAVVRPLQPATTTEALPALVLAENRLNELAEQGRGASHLDIIEVRALVREAGSDKEPWK